MRRIGTHLSPRILSSACLVLATVAACASPPDEVRTEDGVPAAEAAPSPRVTTLPTLPATSPDTAVVARAAGFRSIHSRVRAEGLDDRRFSPEGYWDTVLPLVGRVDGISADSIGASAEGRPLRLIRFGNGDTKVLLWSQMHGDESTASMALADILRFISERPRHPAVRAIMENLDVGIVPVLNPDGAARFERRNSQGIDINRDARALQTPEGQALKRVRDEMEPDFAFNLHDQGIRTRVGESGRGAAIALLAPPDHESRRVTRVRDRAFRVASVIRDAMEPMVEDHIAKYDDTFNPRAFGDLMTQWGASTVLIESGGWVNDPQKQYLRRVNFVGILAALESIATGGWERANPDRYHALPYNGRAVADLVIRGGTLRVPGLPDLQADLLINYQEPLLETGGRIVDVGDMGEAEARDTLDASGLYVLALDEALEFRGERATLSPGAPAWFIASPIRDGSVPEWDFRGSLERTRRR